MQHWMRAVVVGLALALPSAGQASPEMARSIGDALQMDKTLDIMAKEAIANASDVGPDMFGGTNPADWLDSVAALFNPATARAAFDAGLAPAIATASRDDLQAAIDFYQGPFGQRILELELTAREALLDNGVEEGAKQSWAALVDDPMPASAKRAALIRDAIAAGDLIEANVSSALNGNLAFLQGLAEAGGFAAEMTEADMLAEVRNQEAGIRSDTEDWIYPYLAMAYAPLTDDELRAYVDFVKSPAGQALNNVLFLAFDQMSTAQSRGMGLAAGRLMAGQDI